MGNYKPFRYNGRVRLYGIGRGYGYNRRLLALLVNVSPKPRILYGRLNGLYARLYGLYSPNVTLNGRFYGVLNYRARFNARLGYYGRRKHAVKVKPKTYFFRVTRNAYLRRKLFYATGKL